MTSLLYSLSGYLHSGFNYVGSYFVNPECQKMKIYQELLLLQEGCKTEASLKKIQAVIGSFDESVDKIGPLFKSALDKTKNEEVIDQLFACCGAKMPKHPKFVFGSLLEEVDEYHDDVVDEYHDSIMALKEQREKIDSEVSNRYVQELLASKGLKKGSKDGITFNGELLPDQFVIDSPRQENYLNGKKFVCKNNSEAAKLAEEIHNLTGKNFNLTMNITRLANQACTPEMTSPLFVYQNDNLQIQQRCVKFKVNIEYSENSDRVIIKAAASFAMHSIHKDKDLALIWSTQTISVSKEELSRTAEACAKDGFKSVAIERALSKPEIPPLD